MSLGSEWHKAKKAFNDLKSFLCNKSLPFSTRNKVLTCYVLPVVTYNSETWSISKPLAKKINAFGMWCFRRMNRI